MMIHLTNQFISKPKKWLLVSSIALFMIPFLTQANEFSSNGIQIGEVGQNVYDQQVILGGTVIPFKEVMITAQTAGQIDYLAGIEGDVFQSGTLLVAINDAALRAQREAALAQWNRAQVAHQNAITQYNRELWSPKTEQAMPGMGLPNLMDQMFARPMQNQMGMGDSEVSKRADLANASAVVQQSQAEIAMIKAQIDEIDVRLNDTKSTAPFNGVIVEKLVEAGDTVQPGQPLLVFAKSNHLSIEINVPVNLMYGINKGQIFQARIANGSPIPVRVAQVFPIANGQQHTVKVKLDLPLGAAAAPGMYAQVMVHNSQSQQQSFPVIPKSAVVQRGSLPSVFVYNPENNKVSMRIVRTGQASNGNYLSVLSGLQSGEQIVLNPPAGIVSGSVLQNGRLLTTTP
ncbi:efflux protein [Thiosulfatimonas sediminis]|uniref:Efflux protein n=1 Tax=Thiosulfatimonas sediminis TaxID=2675054 RepID=A0A6F8PT48_9GAMM|nr:efflux RND transporter periplasmic adaptor subunit [Thiosulfatimonas sediminis]BBP45204.1 efflux protein [Thiosulfatimonas sediminis]